MHFVQRTHKNVCALSLSMSFRSYRSTESDCELFCNWQSVSQSVSQYVLAL